jgi:hypothetical protein
MMMMMMIIIIIIIIIIEIICDISYLKLQAIKIFRLAEDLIVLPST